MVGWKNPLWKRPGQWMVLGKPSKRSRSARKNDDMIAAMITRARRKVEREMLRRQV